MRALQNTRKQSLDAWLTYKSESLPAPSSQGEMSATIVRFASDWGRLIPGIRQRIAGANGSSAVDVKVGVGLNFNRLDDTTSVAKQFDSSRLSWLAWQVGLEPPAGTRDGVPEIDVEGLRQLFTRQLDFLGISAYAPYNIAGNSFSLNEFENSAFILCNEMLNEYGIDIRGMAAAGKLELQYSEFGIGGGSGYNGGQVRLLAGLMSVSQPGMTPQVCLSFSLSRVDNAARCCMPAGHPIASASRVCTPGCCSASLAVTHIMSTSELLAVQPSGATTQSLGSGPGAPSH